VKKQAKEEDGQPGAKVRKTAANAVEQEIEVCQSDPYEVVVLDGPILDQTTLAAESDGQPEPNSVAKALPPEPAAAPKHPATTKATPQPSATAAAPKLPATAKATWQPSGTAAGYPAAKSGGIHYTPKGGATKPPAAKPPSPVEAAKPPAAASRQPPVAASRQPSAPKLPVASPEAASRQLLAPKPEPIAAKTQTTAVKSGSAITAVKASGKINVKMEAPSAPQPAGAAKAEVKATVGPKVANKAAAASAAASQAILREDNHERQRLATQRAATRPAAAVPAAPPAVPRSADPADRVPEAWIPELIKDQAQYERARGVEKREEITSGRIRGPPLAANHNVQSNPSEASGSTGPDLQTTSFGVEDAFRAACGIPITWDDVRWFFDPIKQKNVMNVRDPPPNVMPPKAPPGRKYNFCGYDFPEDQSFVCAWFVLDFIFLYF